ncbi:transglycosylase SLT domain-containing protein [Rhizobium mayense]|uniref:Transporter substrate-binding domain-containing protein n=1 Tax=Rhizobium mayense TaxID=1312184 RepID=A0ABT7K239_9HYPH|nr:transporter substrate-binding domain-containing protein [Rhizobium mayense]MDL2402675.1 transporter substrate-binding domain-containing protein [Rhizobium mayense]
MKRNRISASAGGWALSVMLAMAMSFVVPMMSPPAIAEEISIPVKGGTYDLDVMEKRRLVRILVPFSKTIYFVDKGRQLGTAVEFGQALEAYLNTGRKKEIEHIRVAFIPVPRNKLLDELNDGVGDIVMANLTITPQRQAIVDFTDPLFDKATEVLVSGPASQTVTGIDDLVSAPLMLRPSSSYWTHVEEINKARTAAGKPPIQLQPIDENLEDEDLMEMVNAGLLPYTVVDQYKAAIWAEVFPDIRVRSDVVISDAGKIAWAVRRNSPLLLAKLNPFVATHRIGTTFGNILKTRYFKSDKIVKRAYSVADVQRFLHVVDLFRQHANTYSFDYLMLIAQGYQESQLDQQRRSARGAVGIMQLLPATAADKAVGITGIDKDESKNIEAASKYLRYLVSTYITDAGITDRDRLLFAFAAYNAGPGNLAKFRKKAIDMGLDPNVWFGNVENAAAAIVGRETVQYVSNIYKYYVAYSLLAARDQAHATAVGASEGGK